MPGHVSEPVIPELLPPSGWGLHLNLNMDGQQMKHLTAFAVVIVTLVAVAGCSSPSAPFPYAESELITGFVTAIARDSESYPLVLIEEQPHYGTDVQIDPHKHGKKVWFAIWPATVFEQQHADGSVTRIRLQDLNIGVRARAWTGNNIADYYPLRTTAARIRVVP